MVEIWKQIDDRYSVSNLGRIKSTYANKERILNPFKDARGYLKVDIRHGEVRKSMMVHRLVASAFIENPNPEKFTEINHKDENKMNNCVDNLEWCDTKYNTNYGTRNQRKAKGCEKPVCSVDKDGNVVHYESRNKAAEMLGIDPTSITKALRSKYDKNKTADKKLWFYDDGTIDQFVKDNNIKAPTFEKEIYSVDNNNNIEYYNSITEAYKLTGINNIARALQNGTIAGGRHWHYKPQD